MQVRRSANASNLRLPRQSTANTQAGLAAQYTRSKTAVAYFGRMQSMKHKPEHQACPAIDIKRGIPMASNLRPLSDRVVIEPGEGEEVTAGGILLPETAKEKPQQGTIVAAGAGRRDKNGKLIAMDVKVGDKVLYARYAGVEITVNNKKVLILKETDILAVVTD
jgi:chaperonin GroES